MLGSGALGRAIGGVLTEAGNDVWLIDQWQAHVDAINANGLTLRDAGGDRIVRARARTTAEGMSVAEANGIRLSIKANEFCANAFAAEAAPTGKLRRSTK